MPSVIQCEQGSKFLADILAKMYPQRSVTVNKRDGVVLFGWDELAVVEFPVTASHPTIKWNPEMLSKYKVDNAEVSSTWETGLALLRGRGKPEWRK